MSRKTTTARPAAGKPAATKTAVKAAPARPAVPAKRAKPTATKVAARTPVPPAKTSAKKKPVSASASKSVPQARASKAPAISAKTTSKATPKAQAKAQAKAPARKTTPAPAPRASAKPAARPAPKSLVKPAPRSQSKPAPVTSSHRPTAVRPGVVVKAFEAALKLFNRGHFGEARDAFEKLIKLYPDHTDIVARSNIYLAISRARTQAAPRLPQTPDTLYDRGVLELNRGHYDDAIGLFEKALKSTPGQPHVLYSLAAALVRAGRADDGLKALEKAIGAKDLYRSKARGDFDFAKVYTDPRFRELVGGFWDSETY